MRLGRAGALALAGLLASALGASPAAADVRVSEHQYKLGALDGWTEVPVAAASAVPGGVILVAGYRHARTGALLAITRMALPNPRARDDDRRVVGFEIGSLFYGEYGILEPTASIDAISVARDARRQHVGAALMRQLRTNLGALGVTRIRTEVSWSDFDPLAFFKKEGFAPAARLCLEQRLSD